MTRATAALLLSTVFLPGTAAAQQVASLPAPRVEFGGGVGYFNSGGTMPVTDVLIQARASVRLSRSWSVEGLFDFRPPTDVGFYGYYRVQAKWRSCRTGVQPFLAVGGAGEVDWYRWNAFQWTDPDGTVLWSRTAGSQFSVGAPIYPTVSIGFEKIVASHLAVRAELGVAFGINDYGLTTAFLPAFSVAIPLGRYASAR